MLLPTMLLFRNGGRKIRQVHAALCYLLADYQLFSNRRGPITRQFSMNTSTGRMKQRTVNALERENEKDIREEKNIIETFMHGTLYVGA